MIDLKVTSAKQAIATLKERGYDDGAIYRYACAARSWSAKDSAELKIWREVEKLTSTRQGEG